MMCLRCIAYCVQIFSADQQILFEFQGTNFVLHIISAYAREGSDQKAVQYGQVKADTPIFFEQTPGERLCAAMDCLLHLYLWSN